MKLETLFAGVEYTGTLPQGDVTLVTQDSRRAGPGAVFVCAKGHTTDGHTFAQKALEAGAACIVTERPLGLQREVQVENGRKAYARLCANYFGHPAEKLRLVAVTGTNGKTTVSTVIKQVLEQAGYKLDSAEISRIPQNTVAPDAAFYENIEKLLDMLEENDDIQNVYHNAEMDA